ncbi:MAG: hypothetical protein NUV86_02620 [Candidatus Scalindua sp.]|nr:hypothetical protein [Candidatus Scalindua sp.]MCR4345521.1 hypothetical protein [Candidatus Scalindua sp.]
MVGKCKSLVIFIAVVGITCIVLNFAGIDTQVYAQDATNAKSRECPLDKGGECSSDKDCSKKPKCDKGGCHNIDKMMDLTRCAKKELLKEKIKANLEKKMGTKLDKIADLLVDAMLNEYRASMGCKTQKAALENNIREVFSGEDE